MEFESKYKNYSAEECYNDYYKKRETLIKLKKIIGIIWILIGCLFIKKTSLFFIIILGLYIFAFIMNFIGKIFGNWDFYQIQKILLTDCEPQKFIEVLDLFLINDKEGKSKSTINLYKAMGYYYLANYDEMKKCLLNVNFKKWVFPREYLLINLWLNYSLKTKQDDLYKEYLKKLNNFNTKDKKQRYSIDNLKKNSELSIYIEENNKEKANNLIKEISLDKNATYKNATLLNQVLHRYSYAKIYIMNEDNEKALEELYFVKKFSEKLCIYNDVCKLIEEINNK